MPFPDIKSADNWVAIASAAVALVSAATTAFLAQAKNAREKVEFRSKYFENFRKWAEASATILTEAIHLCDLQPDKCNDESFFDRRHRLRTALSNQIDIGRWFFPNIEIDDHGTQKEPGFKGYRHEVLDGLVSGYRAMDHLDYNNKQNNHRIRLVLTESKRHFVGQVQQILDPGSQNEQFERIARKR